MLLSLNRSLRSLLLSFDCLHSIAGHVVFADAGGVTVGRMQVQQWKGTKGMHNGLC